MNDISNLEDIKTFVNGFYDLVRSDELLGPVFVTKIPADEWDRHLGRMYDFWNTVLFFKQTYKGNPFSRHIGLSIDSRHFLRWTDIFKAVVDQHFDGPVAKDTKRRADNIADMFMLKLEAIREHQDIGQ